MNAPQVRVLVVDDEPPIRRLLHTSLSAHGYQVEELRVFDSFPLTHHIESVAVLTR